MVSENHKTGVWFIGARGAIAISTMAGNAILEAGEGPLIGLTTANPPFQEQPFIPWAQLCFGGCDVQTISLETGLRNILQERIIPLDFQQTAAKGIQGVEARITDLNQLLSPARPAELPALQPMAVIEALRTSLREFKNANQLARTIVVNLASTEAWCPTTDQWQAMSWDEFKKELQSQPHTLPWGIIYATAALLEGCAFINFTPNLGTEIHPLEDLAQRRALPHAGKDGKTGETLLKSVLAPMFESRVLEVLTWQGFNMLGNSDGAALANPSACEAKIRSKDRQLRSILKSSPDLHTKVSIDYVPSLGDWKVAWDFIHFKGFLGVPMSMQLTWQGCDKTLAVPLVLDLIRFVELAWRRGETGHLAYLDAFFKSPTNCRDHDFRNQITALHRQFNLIP